MLPRKTLANCLKIASYNIREFDYTGAWLCPFGFPQFRFKDIGILGESNHKTPVFHRTGLGVQGVILRVPLVGNKSEQMA